MKIYASTSPFSLADTTMTLSSRRHFLGITFLLLLSSAEAIRIRSTIHTHTHEHETTGTKTMQSWTNSEILQLNMTNGAVHDNKPLVTGHSFGEVWGLATHPLNNSMFATSGDDKTVRMWHISSTPSSSHECIAVTEPDALPDMSRALVFEPTTGDWLVAGLGGRLGVRKIGTFGKHAGSIVSLDATNLNVLGMMKVAKEQIGDMAFTMDGKTLAVASNDNFIYLVNCNGPMDMHVRHRCTGHSSFVTDVSVSIDSKWMMSNDGKVAVQGWGFWCLVLG